MHGGSQPPPEKSNVSRGHGFASMSRPSPPPPIIFPPRVFDLQQVAVLIAQGDMTAAVKALNHYLHEFAADPEAWLQLAKLHIEALNYEVGTPSRNFLPGARYEGAWQAITH